MTKEALAVTWSAAGLSADVAAFYSCWLSAASHKLFINFLSTIN